MIFYRFYILLSNQRHDIICIGTKYNKKPELKSHSCRIPPKTCYYKINHLASGIAPIFYKVLQLTWVTKIETVSHIMYSQEGKRAPRYGT